MGLISSKLFKSDLKSSKAREENENKAKPSKDITEIEDPRSPNCQIIRTPIIVEKLHSKEDFTKEHKSVSLRTKLLKSLKADPRSPTVGIYRTPIVVEEIESDKAKPNKCESPVSIYSSNLSSSIVQEVMTPVEPSVNVSGFEINNMLDSEDDITLKDDCKRTAITVKNSSLKVTNRPHTFEARKLLDEIIMNDEENYLNIKIVKVPLVEEMDHLKTSDGKTVNELKEKKQKSRPPLLNITSSTNSPNQMKTAVKLYSKSKMLSESGSENLDSPKVTCLAQWDQNNTVII